MEERGTGYFFGEYRLCPETHELTRNGKDVCVPEKIFRLLTYLVENRDRAVTKDELLDKIWDGKPLSATVVARSIMKARRAIGDDSESQNYIRTIPTFGYHFAAEVNTVHEICDNSIHTMDVRAAPTPQQGANRSPGGSIGTRNQLVLFMAIVLLFSGIAGGLFYHYTSGEESPAFNTARQLSASAGKTNPAKKIGLAILPVKTIPESGESLSPRITMLLDRGLSRVSWLTVIAAKSPEHLNNEFSKYCLLSTELIRTQSGYTMTYMLEIPGSAKMMGEFTEQTPLLVTEEVIKVVSKMTHEANLM